MPGASRKGWVSWAAEGDGALRIAVTGIGAVTPLGIGREELWRGLLAGRVPISSIKSMLGHTMGAAAAIEAAVCALAVANDEIPPTMGLEEPDGDLDYVPNAARRHRVEVAMNNAYAFGGSNASTVFRKCGAA